MIVAWVAQASFLASFPKVGVEEEEEEKTLPPCLPVARPWLAFVPLLLKSLPLQASPLQRRVSQSLDRQLQ